LGPEISNHAIVSNGEHVVGDDYVPNEAHGNGNFARESSAADLVLGLWRERRFVAKAFVAGMLVAAVISLLIPRKYESTTRLMPPEKGGLGGLAAMLAAAGIGGGDDKAGSLVGGLVSDAVGLKSSSALFIGVLKSTTVQDELVDKFNLRKVYRVTYQKDAREVLSDNTDINEDRKSGIIAITVTDRSPQRAMQIARAYADELGRLTAQLNMSAAHRERVFLEERLKQVKQDLDAASKDLSDFSSRNLTLDVKEQGKAMVTGAAALEGELIAAESELSGLRQIYTSNNIRVRSLQARVDELRSKLAELRGNSTDAWIEGGKSGDLGVSIAKLPVLGLTYYDLYRKAKIQETVFEILTKQCELAKIEEAKEVPSIKVLDEALVPEKKSSPKRMLITIFGALLAALLAAAYVMASAHWLRLGASHPLSLLGLEMRAGLGEDWVLLQRRTPERIRRIAGGLWTRVTRRKSESSNPA
jgi:uncharacterized protein involved in exopolysaccharide biosynthesis